MLLDSPAGEVTPVTTVPFLCAFSAVTEVTTPAPAPQGSSLHTVREELIQKKNSFPFSSPPPSWTDQSPDLFYYPLALGWVAITKLFELEGALKVTPTSSMDTFHWIRVLHPTWPGMFPGMGNPPHHHKNFLPHIYSYHILSPQALLKVCPQYMRKQ